MPYRNPESSWPLIVVLKGIISALSRETGEIQWGHNMDESVWRSAQPARLAFHEDLLFVATPTRLACIHQSGELRWSVVRQFSVRKTAAATTGPVVAHDCQIYLASSGEIECYDFDGELLWTNPMKGKGYGPIAMGFPDSIGQGDAIT